MKGRRTAWKRLRRLGATGSLVLIITLTLALGARGQENAEFELSATRGVGIGDPGQRIGHAAWGGSFYGGWRLPRTPFTLGARLAMTNYGSQHNADLAGFSSAVPPDVRYSYNLLTTHLVFRYQPRGSFLAPYLEALVGFNYFFTQAYHGNSSSVPIIVGDAILSIDAGGSKTLMSSLSPSLGLGGGLKVRLARIGRGKQSPRPPLSVFLNLEGCYVHGGAARYLRRGGLTLDGDRLISEPQRSQTNLFFFSLGLSVGVPSRDKQSRQNIRFPVRGSTDCPVKPNHLPSGRQ